MDIEELSGGNAKVFTDVNAFCIKIGSAFVSPSVYIRAHAKSLKKVKAKLKELTSHSQGRKIQTVMEKVNIYILKV